MIPKQAGCKHTEVLPTVPVNISTIQHAGVRSIQMIDVCPVDPSNGFAIAVKNWSHSEFGGLC
jgi:hypothetical protein